jgi:hypothetical protein
VPIATYWWVGIIFGFVHWLFFGMFMGMLPAVHPRVGGGAGTPQAAGAASMGSSAGAGAAIPAPGPFALQYGMMATMGSLLVHLIYGVVTVLVIGQFWHP